MTENEKRQLFIGLYENTCRAILDIESECLRFNETLSTRKRDVLRTANDFKFIDGRPTYTSRPKSSEAYKSIIEYRKG